MEDFYLGNSIRKLRKQKKLTLDELADGICSKRQLQRIETNITIPSADIIFKLSKKLDENLKEYFPYSHFEDPIEMAKLIKTLEQLYEARDYLKLYELSKEYVETDIKSPEFKQIICYYHWNAAIYLEIDPLPDEHYFLSLLGYSIESPSEDTFFTSFRTLFEYKIIYSYIVIKYFDDIYEKPLDIRTQNMNAAIKLLKQVIFHYTASYKILDYNFVCRLYNNIAHSYNILGEHDKAIYYADKALSQYVLFCSLSVIAMLHYVKGYALAKLDQEDSAKSSFRYFIKLHEMIGDSEYVAPLIESLKTTYNLS
ncbi:MAG TPA: hypothetical protein DCY20_11210 [Firmicutes bacterium]|nr:hypothetical protein [Bacillota bacterium]